MLIVKGVSENSGVFQGFNYHNLILHVERTEAYNCEGVRCEQKKIKWRNLNHALGLGMNDREVEQLTYKDFSDLIDKEIEIYCNDYKEVVKVDVLGIAEKEAEN